MSYIKKKEIAAISGYNGLKSKAHLLSQTPGHIYMPLCAKPSFVALLDQNPDLLEESIIHCLDTVAEEQDIVIFIADGAVMEEACKAMECSPSRAHRITASIADQLKAKVNKALARINNPRIRGLVHWEDVASSPRFRQVLASMENIMNSRPEECELVADVQHHVKMLVKNLFTQRVEKMGNNITNVFTGEGLEIRTGGKYAKRYRHLQRACLLELSSILVGLEHGDQLFTEMQYLTNDPQGMTFIAACLEAVREVATGATNQTVSCINQPLIQASSVTHGITFIKQEPLQTWKKQPSVPSRMV